MEAGRDNIRFESMSSGTEEPTDPWIASIMGHAAAHGGASDQDTCPYPCPICTAIGFVKQMNPDVAGHLAAAGRELMLATKAIFESTAEASQGSQDSDKIPFD